MSQYLEFSVFVSPSEADKHTGWVHEWQAEESATPKKVHEPQRHAASKTPRRESETCTASQCTKTLQKISRHYAPFVRMPFALANLRLLVCAKNKENQFPMAGFDGGRRIEKEATKKPARSSHGL
jgi:hypothetical protein